jgi:hypothetical protein
VRNCVLDLSRSGEKSLEGADDHGNEITCSITDGELL